MNTQSAVYIFIYFILVMSPLVTPHCTLVMHPRDTEIHQTHLLINAIMRGRKYFLILLFSVCQKDSYRLHGPHLLSIISPRLEVVTCVHNLWIQMSLIWFDGYRCTMYSRPYRVRNNLSYTRHTSDDWTQGENVSEQRLTVAQVTNTFFPDTFISLCLS